MRSLEKILFFGLLVMLPSQLGYHFWPDWSLINGIRTDYLSPTIYVTDFLIVALMIVSRKWFRLSKWVIAFAVFNILISLSPLLTVTRWLRVYEYYWLYQYLVGFTNLRSKVQTGLAMALFWVAVLAGLQFWLQKSVGGIWYWLGERSFSVSTPGIAKVFWPNQGLTLRPYATLPHPNALAGWALVVGLLQNQTGRVLSWLVVLLSLSRSAIALLPLTFWPKLKWLVLMLMAVVVLFVFPLGNPSSWTERMVLITQAGETIRNHPVWGVGLGNFVYTVPSIRQPVHNIYLLLVAELGLPVAIYIFFKVAMFVMVSDFRLRLVVTSILALGMVDHYWITLQQNILMLVIVLALVKINSNETQNTL